MSKSLYNKYRSQTFDELVGQEGVTRLLKNAVKKGKIANAYLLVGSRGTGKTSTARILAKALNCSSLTEEGNPCNECESCKSISLGSFLDLIEIDAASNRGIDQIRELKEKLEFSPSEGKFKIYIIDEVHMLTKEAFNALLKTLEEPPKHVVFILATTDVHKLPPTILSRCQRYDFKLGSDEQIRKVIVRSAKSENVDLDDGALDIIVNNAKGSYRDAMSLLDVVVSGQVQSENPSIISEQEVRTVLGMTSDDFVDRFLSSMVSGNSRDALALVYQVEKDGVNMSQFVKQILERLRQVLVGKITGEGRESVLNEFDLLTINKVIADFIGVDRNIKYSSFPILSIELLISQYSNGNQAISTIKSSPVNEKVEVKSAVSVVKSEVVNISNKGIQEDDTIEEEEPSNKSDDDVVQGKVDFKSVQEKWTNLLQIVQSTNGPLAAILRNSQLLTIDSGTMSIQVPFEFYKDRVEESKSKEILNGALKDLFGISLKIACVVNGSVKKKRQVSADVILSNIPQEKSEKAPATKFDKPRVSKKVEAIFEGM
ncbi:DNA polymerase III subunit gamma/tau [Candidatus Dojkabacteria bacterium]|nr:DNA polymerase III subunit gamma/tau [Candidatus Dojkabacteria bacterium]